jgi:hypothetical protein
LQSLHFRARELKPYAEYAEAHHLAVGKTYFAVHFLDKQMLVPEMRALVFVGRDFEPEDDGILYFQDAESYSSGARYANTSGHENVQFHTVDEDTPLVCEFERALDCLLRCSIEREKAVLP